MSRNYKISEKIKSIHDIHHVKVLLVTRYYQQIRFRMFLGQIK